MKMEQKFYSLNIIHKECYKTLDSFEDKIMYKVFCKDHSSKDKIKEIYFAGVNKYKKFIASSDVNLRRQFLDYNQDSKDVILKIIMEEMMKTFVTFANQYKDVVLEDDNPFIIWHLSLKKKLRLKTTTINYEKKC